MFGLGWGFQHTQSSDLVVDSPVFSDHVELQVMGFMGPAFINWDGSSQFPKLDKIEIKKLATERLIVSYGTGNSLSYTRNFGRDHACHLRDRLRRWDEVPYSIPLLHTPKRSRHS